MKKFLFVALCTATLGAQAARVVEGSLPTDAEIRAKQALGRAVIAPDGRSFVYEWMRPYARARAKGPVPVPAGRMQTWLYRVDVERAAAGAEYLVFPQSDASYWLGAFSPDGKRLSFYELDREGVLRAGVVTFTAAGKSTMAWFEPAPDGARLEQAPVWLSNDELVYPAASGERLVGNVTTADTRPCQPCDAPAAVATVPNAPGAAALPAGTRILARSAGGEVTVYGKSDAQVLSLLVQKAGDAAGVVVFENPRRLTVPPHKM